MLWEARTCLTARLCDRLQVTQETMKLLFDLADKVDLSKKMKAMARGEKINFTEDRAVLHMVRSWEAPGRFEVQHLTGFLVTRVQATRASRDESIMVEGQDVVKQVGSPRRACCCYSLTNASYRGSYVCVAGSGA
jgi:hypothetical protein